MKIKNNNPIKAINTFKYPLIVFFGSTLFSVVFALFWIYYGDEWERLSDGYHYMAMYNDNVAASPFGYRILTPYLARLLPWEAMNSFKFITICSVSLTSGFLGLYTIKMKMPLIFTITLTLFWVLSFPFIFSSTTIVRVDAPMLLLISIIILFSKYRVSYIFLSLLIIS